MTAPAPAASPERRDRPRESIEATMTTYQICKRYAQLAGAAVFAAAPNLGFAAGSGSGSNGSESGALDLLWAISPWINFAVFVGIVIYYAVPAAEEFFQDKRADLAEDLEEAERLRREAEARLEEYKAKLEALEGKREELMDEYREQGEREKERIIEEAERQVEKMRADAEQTIDQEVRKAIARLEEEAVDLAVEMAETMAREQLGAEDHDQLIESYVDDLADRTDTQRRS